MAKLWKWPFVNFVFEGVIGMAPQVPQADEIHARLDRLDEQIGAVLLHIRGRDELAAASAVGADDQTGNEARAQGRQLVEVGAKGRPSQKLKNPLRA